MKYASRLSPPHFLFALVLVLATGILCACEAQPESDAVNKDFVALNDRSTPNESDNTEDTIDTPPETEETSGLEPSPVDQPPAEEQTSSTSADELKASLNLYEDYRNNFLHGEKPAAYQKYIVLHDTESDSDPQSIIDWWDGNGNLVAAHFIVGKDGTVVQCVPLDKITHHAGFGDTGHNVLYAVEDESRDDKNGTVSIGDWAADYGMNSYSIGIEMVHAGGGDDYPEAQLEALDKLIAYIDAYYGFESTIIDHKAWRSGNSDTSAEFADYLANYQTYRKHTLG